MLKSVSSITNAIGALNFQGTWNASTNSPALASSVGTKGDYYVVGTAGSTTLNGISNWGVGDLATFNGSVWQRVEGGADGNFVNLSVSGTSTLSNLTASTALALDASKNIVSVTNTGTGSNVLATTPTLVGDISLSTGNLVIGTSGKGIDFSATAGTGTSELLADYEEGTWTPSLGGTATYGAASYGRYTKIGRVVTVQFRIDVTLLGTGSNTILTGLPFTSSSVGIQTVSCSYYASLAVNTIFLAGYIDGGSTNMYFLGKAASGSTVDNNIALFGNGTVLIGTASYIV